MAKHAGVVQADHVAGVGVLFDHLAFLGPKQLLGGRDARAYARPGAGMGARSCPLGEWPTDPHVRRCRSRWRGSMFGLSLNNKGR